MKFAKEYLVIFGVLSFSFSALAGPSRRLSKSQSHYSTNSAKRAVAQSSFEQGAMQNVAEAPTTFRIQFQASSGVGFFQDIQTPVNQITETRADGSAVGSEGINHLGLPLDARMTSTIRQGSLAYDLVLDGLYMSTLSGPPETRNSTYARLSALLDARYYLRFLGRDGSIGFGVEGRRSMYRNISSGHYLDTVSPEMSLAMGREQVGKVELYGSKSVVSKLSYQSGLGAGSGALPSSVVDFYDAGLRITRRIGTGTSLKLEWNQETSHINIANTKDYDRFGLNTGLADDEVGFHSQTMLTNLFLVGLARSF